MGDFIQDALDHHPMASFFTFIAGVLLLSFVFLTGANTIAVYVSGSDPAPPGITVETSYGTYECTSE